MTYPHYLTILIERDGTHYRASFWMSDLVGRKWHVMGSSSYYSMAVRYCLDEYDRRIEESKAELKRAEMAV